MDKGHLVDVKASVRACVISSRDRMTIQDLQKDFQVFTGQPLPYASLGFNSAEQLLRSLPDAVEVMGHGPQALLKHVPSEKSEHIANFVKHQKTPKNKRPQHLNGRGQNQQPCLGMDVPQKNSKALDFEKLSVYNSSKMESSLIKYPTQAREVKTQSGKENRTEQILNQTLLKPIALDENQQLQPSGEKEKVILHNYYINYQDKNTIRPEIPIRKILASATSSLDLDMMPESNWITVGQRCFPVKEEKITQEEAIPENAMLKTDIMERLSMNRYSMERETSTRKNLKIPQCTLYEELKQDSIISLYVSEIYSALSFYFHIDKEDHELIKLEDQLQKAYSVLAPNHLNFSSANLEPGKFCAAKNEDTWYRAKILSVPTFLNGFCKIKLLFVDYGCVGEVPIKHIKCLASVFFKIPVQAGRGSLSGIKSNGLASSVCSTNFFASLVHDRCLYAYVSGIDKNVPSVDLILVDTSSEPKCNINEALIRKGLAERNNLK